MDANTVNDLRTPQRASSTTRQQRIARAPRRPLLRRIFGRKEVSTFHRCLAVHMHYAERHGLLR